MLLEDIINSKKQILKDDVSSDDVFLSASWTKITTLVLKCKNKKMTSVIFSGIFLFILSLLLNGFVFFKIADISKNILIVKSLSNDIKSLKNSVEKFDNPYSFSELLKGNTKIFESLLQIKTTIANVDSKVERSNASVTNNHEFSEVQLYIKKNKQKK